VSEYEVRVADERVEIADGWSLVWVDREDGIGLLVSPERAVPVLVEGSGTDWTVTIRGRRIPVTVRSWRERVLAEAEGATRAHGGAVTVKASLPGLVVGIHVDAGDEVEEGESLLTIEAMKMQNEVRAPRPARIAAVAVTPGQVVATGDPLLTLE
jgi:biotin carboxyl carrier protein